MFACAIAIEHERYCTLHQSLFWMLIFKNLTCLLAVKANEFDCFFTNIVNKCISVGTFSFNFDETVYQQKCFTFSTLSRKIESLSQGLDLSSLSLSLMQFPYTLLEVAIDFTVAAVTAS